jgi:uncharacterized membrane protein
MKSEVNRNYRNMFLLSIAVVFVMFLMSGYVWLQFLDSVDETCFGWSIGGICSEYGRNFLIIFAIPILMGVTLGLLRLLVRFEPRQQHLVQSQKALTTIWAAWLIFFLVMQAVLMLDFLGRESTIATYWPILAGLVSIVMGNYLGKIRSNTLAGFRTPWTLSSELSWNKTHRLGGKLLFVLGLILIAGPLIITGDFWVYFIIVASLLWTVVLAIFSYYIWKRDPDHTQPSLQSK